MDNEITKKKLKELEQESMAAASEVTRLESPGNILSTDPNKKTQQIDELQEARMREKVAAKTLDKLMNYLADIEAESVVNAIITESITIPQQPTD